MGRKHKVRHNTPRSGEDAGGGGSNGGGGKRGIPIKGWEKGDIVRDMVVQPDGPQIPRKPGSRREDRTVEAKENHSESAAAPEQESREGQDE
jgi:hypothetical protein